MLNNLWAISIIFDFEHSEEAIGFKMMIIFFTVSNFLTINNNCSCIRCIHTYILTYTVYIGIKKKLPFIPCVQNEVYFINVGE